MALVFCANGFNTEKVERDATPTVWSDLSKQALKAKEELATNPEAWIDDLLRNKEPPKEQAKDKITMLDLDKHTLTMRKFCLEQCFYKLSVEKKPLKIASHELFDKWKVLYHNSCPSNLTIMERDMRQLVSKDQLKIGYAGNVPTYTWIGEPQDKSQDINKLLGLS
ncbi:hypothetical protein RFI_14455 [Reticulomyxa filosa]|uniref:Uncharacterized protein n=1 Tax=Reticulomyxa filosa TaxID=46433 RepID=X6NA04_RETFI|nr:hypothetical protein RFI_14455 [Reticulomyxa filosa]|eukprot:ETO22738.1 hypothetical protein RFI_14455 [Reticulomyxa filosa]